jgi:hypothetical protein
MTVQQKIVRDPIVILRDVDAFFSVNGHAEHDQGVRQGGLDCCDLRRAQQFRRRAQVNDLRLQEL